MRGKINIVNLLPDKNQMQFSRLLIVYGIAAFSLLILDGLTPVLAQPTGQNAPKLEILLDKMEPTTVPVGTDFSVLVFVNNPGTIESSAFTIKLLISPTQEFEEDSSVFGALSLNPIPARGSSGIPWQGKLHQPPGTYWVTVCVVPNGQELNQESSCTAGREIVVPKIDLIVNQVEVRPQMIVSGVAVLMRAAVDNHGAQSSELSRLHYVLSSNPEITRSDPILATQEVPAIESGKRWGEPTRAVFKSMPGEYWIGACLDPVEGDIEARNNCSQGSQISIVEDLFPDLVIQSVLVRPESWAEGTTVDFYAEVLNSGSKPSVPGRVGFYLSENPDITSEDTSIGFSETEAIAAGGQFNAYLVVSPPVFPGIYWLGACVEPDESEFDTFNNCASGAQVEITNFNFSD